MLILQELFTNRLVGSSCLSLKEVCEKPEIEIEVPW